MDLEDIPVNLMRIILCEIEYKFGKDSEYDKLCFQSEYMNRKLEYTDKYIKKLFIETFNPNNLTMDELQNE